MITSDFSYNTDNNKCYGSVKINNVIYDYEGEGTIEKAKKAVAKLAKNLNQLTKEQKQGELITIKGFVFKPIISANSNIFYKNLNMVKEGFFSLFNKTKSIFDTSYFSFDTPSFSKDNDFSGLGLKKINPSNPPLDGENYFPAISSTMAETKSRPTTPKFIRQKIFSYLKGKDLLALRGTSKFFNQEMGSFICDPAQKDSLNDLSAKNKTEENQKNENKNEANEKEPNPFLQDEKKQESVKNIISSLEIPQITNLKKTASKHIHFWNTAIKVGGAAIGALATLAGGYFLWKSYTSPSEVAPTIKPLLMLIPVKPVVNIKNEIFDSLLNDVHEKTAVPVEKTVNHLNAMVKENFTCETNTLEHTDNQKDNASAGTADEKINSTKNIEIEEIPPTITRQASILKGFISQNNRWLIGGGIVGVAGTIIGLAKIVLKKSAIKTVAVVDDPNNQREIDSASLIQNQLDNQTTVPVEENVNHLNSMFKENFNYKTSTLELTDNQKDSASAGTDGSPKKETEGDIKPRSRLESGTFPPTTDSFKGETNKTVAVVDDPNSQRKIESASLIQNQLDNQTTVPVEENVNHLNSMFKENFNYKTSTLELTDNQKDSASAGTDGSPKKETEGDIKPRSRLESGTFLPTTDSFKGETNKTVAVVDDPNNQRKIESASLIQNQLDNQTTVPVEENVNHLNSMFKENFNYKTSTLELTDNQKDSASAGTAGKRKKMRFRSESCANFINKRISQKDILNDNKDHVLIKVESSKEKLNKYHEDCKELTDEKFNSFLKTKQVDCFSFIEEAIKDYVKMDFEFRYKHGTEFIKKIINSMNKSFYEEMRLIIKNIIERRELIGFNCSEIFEEFIIKDKIGTMNFIKNLIDENKLNQELFEMFKYLLEKFPQEAYEIANYCIGKSGSGCLEIVRNGFDLILKKNKKEAYNYFINYIKSSKQISEIFIKNNLNNAINYSLMDEIENINQKNYINEDIIELFKFIEKIVELKKIDKNYVICVFNSLLSKIVSKTFQLIKKIKKLEGKALNEEYKQKLITCYNFIDQISGQLVEIDVNNKYGLHLTFDFIMKLMQRKSVNFKSRIEKMIIRHYINKDLEKSNNFEFTFGFMKKWFNEKNEKMDAENIFFLYETFGKNNIEILKFFNESFSEKINETIEEVNKKQINSEASKLNGMIKLTIFQKLNPIKI